MELINRQEIHAKYQGHCAYCGKEITVKEMHVDHIFPKSKVHYLKSETMKADVGTAINGINEEKNLNPACITCNLWKKSFTLEQFRKELGLQIERCNHYSRNYRIAKLYGLVAENPDKLPVVFYFEKVLV